MMRGFARVHLVLMAAAVAVGAIAFLGEVAGGRRAPETLSWSLGGKELRDLDLRGWNLRGVNLAGAWLVDIDLRGADLREANLSVARLERCDLRGARLTGADLMGARLIDCRLRWSELDEFWHPGGTPDRTSRGREQHWE